MTVIGGGIAGLGASLALARQGHDVEVLERDAAPVPETPVAAFEGWERRGAPQVRHSHAFLARLRNGLRDRAPDLLAALLEAGAEELRFADLMPASIEDRTPRPGDEELTMLACRRATFEWVLRRAAEAESRVCVRRGAEVTGVTLDPAPSGGLARVTGVDWRRGRRDARGTTSRADLVVDAGGRRSRMPRWLAEAGAPRPEEEREPCGIFYCSRFFRLRPGVSPPDRDTTIGADMGYLKYAIFHGDSGIFSVTLAASPEDAPLRSVLRTEAFEQVTARLPAVATWTERAEPISGVHGMASLHNTRRFYHDGDAPLVEGLAVLGDAAIHTNPLYGRGCTLALVHAWLLADAVAEHGATGRTVLDALEEGTRREIAPWYEMSRRQDRDALELARRYAAGVEPDAGAASSGPGAPVDPKAFLRSLIVHGLVPALRTDAEVARVFFRSFNCMVAPTDIMKDPLVLQRVMACYQKRHEREEPRLGPSRADLVAELAAA